MTSNPNDNQIPSRLDLADLKFLTESGLSPRAMLGLLAPDIEIPPNADDSTLFRLAISLTEPPKRNKLAQYNTLGDAVELIKKSNKIIVLSGAGLSTSAGLPDFRSRNGIYKQIHQKHPDLRDPKSMFDIKYFRKNPQPFYHFAKALFPGQYQPTVGHLFIKCIEEHDKLLNNYTQNIDTLEKQAGIKRVVECHGSFAKATCTSCRYSLDGDFIKKDIFNQRIPICPLCHTSEDGPQDGLGIMKPNIVFFGEQLSGIFHDTLESDKYQVDLLIVIGSSLKVRPVALLPTWIPAEVPQILINREPLDHFNFDIELLGNCDDIIQELCFRLGNKWTKVCPPNAKRLVQLEGPDKVKISQTSVEQKAEKESLSKQVESSRAGTSKEHERQYPKEESEENLEVGGDTFNGANKTEIMGKSDGGDNVAGDQDSDWADIEVLDSDDSSTNSDDDIRDKLDFDVPEGSYIFVQPNKYVFKGAEMTKSQYKKIIKN